jgi:pre-mRNA-processing factor 40
MRHLQDDLRYALKKLEPPVDIDATFEAVEPSLKDLPEYKALDDANRKAAFAKFVKRQKVGHCLDKLRERAG